MMVPCIILHNMLGEDSGMTGAKTKVMVAILLGRSLFAEAIGRQLMRASDHLSVMLVDATASNTFERLSAVSPDVIILDDSDKGIQEQGNLIERLLHISPPIKIIYLNSQTRDTRVVSSDCLSVNKVEDLVNVIEDHDF
jgi:hypothetical protein